MANKDQKTTDEPTPVEEPTPAEEDAPETSEPTESSDSTNGTTTIADGVVAKIAGVAAREVPGVYALGGGGARALGMIRSVVNAEDAAQGIKVEVGERQAAADVTIVVEYPAPVHEVASQVRAAITAAITNLIGLEVVEVNVAVDDVHLPTESKEGDVEKDAPQEIAEPGKPRVS